MGENPDGLTISSISAMLGMNRNSAAKYLGMLQMQGSVTLRRTGTSKVYCLADRMPADAVLKLTKSHVLLFNQALVAVDTNDSLRDIIHISKKEIIGKTLDQLPFSVQNHPELAVLIREGIQGKESRKTAVIAAGDRSLPCMLTISPVYFENGNNGVSLVIDFSQEPGNGDIPAAGINGPLTGMDGIEYICQFGADRTLTYANNAYCGMMKKSREELIGHPWQPVTLEKELRKIQKNLASLDPAHPHLNTEFRAIMPDGESQWQQWKFRGIFDNTGQVIHYHGVGLDITSGKKIEERLRAKEQELENLAREHKREILELNRQIYTEISAHEKKDFQLQFTQFSMDNASYMIIWTGKDGQFVYMNKKAREILGYARRELLTRKIGGILSPDTAFSWEAIWKHIEQNRHFTIESSVQTMNNGDIPVEIFFNYLEFKEKQYCCCFAKDISEKKQTEEAKRESELRFRAIFHSTFEFIALLRPDGTLLEVNEAALRFGGLALSEVIGKPFWETGWWTISTQTKVQLRNAIARAARGITVQYVVDIIGGGSRVATIDFSLKPVTDDAGMVASLIAEGHDITERMQYVAALTASERRYRSLYENMLEGYAYGNILHEHEVPKDFVFIEVNSAFEQLTGLSNVAGKKASELMPGILASNPELLQAFGRVALTGTTERFETCLPSLELYLSVTVYSQEEGYFTAMFENITERRRVEDALRESSRKYAELFELGSEAVFLIDNETGALREANAAAGEMYGYSRDALLAMKNTDLSAEKEETRKVTTGTPPGTVQVPLRYHRRKDGTVFPVEILGRFFTWNERPVHIAAIRDITDRRQAEEALRESEEKYRQLVELAQEGIWAIDAGGKTTYVNPRMAGMLGYTVEEMQGVHLYSFMDNGRKAIAAENMERRRQGITEDHEFEFITKGGKRIHAALATAPITDENGVYRGALAVVSDITGRRRAEASLKESENKYRTLVENIPEKIFIKDASLAYVSCNEPYARDLGIAAGAIAKKTDFDFYPHDLADKYRADDRAVMESGTASRFEERYVINGIESWVSTLKTPIRDNAGNVTGILGIFHDITGRRQVEEDFKEKTLRQLQVSYENLQKTQADLRLHQTELEVQNEELQRTQHELEVSRERYFELYELAPVAYLTLSEKGLILNANLTAATLLGVERHQLIKKPLSRYILPAEQDIFYHCRKEVIETRQRQSCELHMLHAGGSQFAVQLIAVPAPAGERDEAAISLMVIELSGRTMARGEAEQ